MGRQAFGIQSKQWWTALALVGSACGAGIAGAAPISIGTNSLFMFRDNRGVNDLGIAAGDRLQYGSTNVIGGSGTTSVGAFYAPQNLTDAASACGPLLTNPNFCSNSIPYANTNPNSPNFGVPRTAEPWTFTFTRPNEASVTRLGPSLVGTDFKVPQPVSVSASGSGLTPTINWQLPAGYVPDGFRLQIYDKSRIRTNGIADIIHSVALSETATSYTLPSTLSTGLSLLYGGNYSINFEVIETRGDVTFTGSNVQILTRSQSFFSFTPLQDAGPPNVHLPEVGEDTNPNDNLGAPYQFSIELVGPNDVVFIDPFVATGYDYKIGTGDPNFASVKLPNVGDGIFELIFGGPGGLQSILLNQGTQYFFPDEGVSEFSVRGIETSAGLDPNDTTAFITGLTFVTDGSFTGTMTPILTFIPDAAVPLPGTLALLGIGWLAALRSRRASR